MELSLPTAVTPREQRLGKDRRVLAGEFDALVSFSKINQSPSYCLRLEPGGDHVVRDLVERCSLVSANPGSISSRRCFMAAVVTSPGWTHRCIQKACGEVAIVGVHDLRLWQGLRTGPPFYEHALAEP